MANAMTTRRRRRSNHRAASRLRLVLELDDTEHLAVMAVQRSDGPHAQAEAGRMAALVQVHSKVHDR